MASAFRVETRFNHLPAVEAALRPATEAACMEAGAFLHQRAFLFAHVITGSMRDSVYEAGPRGSGYGAAVARAEADNPPVTIVPEAPTPAPGPGGVRPTVVGVAALHGQFEEARPGHEWFGPAIQETRAVFPNIAIRRVRSVEGAA